MLQRKCACGNHTSGGECEACKKKHEAGKGVLQRSALSPFLSPWERESQVPPIVHDVLRSPGQPLDAETLAFMEPRFGHDFSSVRVHSDFGAARSARAVNALAYTVGQDVVFGSGQYAPNRGDGRELIAHELTHVVQQSSTESSGAVDRIEPADAPAEHNAESIARSVMADVAAGPIRVAAHSIQRRAAPYIKKITVHLAPSQSADLEWQDAPPATATGSDHFTVSTGKGYGDPGDPPGTCTRDCCSDPDTQCAPPWNRPDRVGACCTYHGNNFWTGVPQEEHNGWQWWTPIQPYYSSRGIALHQHTAVTGQPIGHGCVRMDEPNAKRIYDYSNRGKTNVTIEGRAAPVACDASRRCGGSGGANSGAGEQQGSLDGSPDDPQLTFNDGAEAVPRLEGELT
jgi:hypothetical protein